MRAGGTRGHFPTSPQTTERWKPCGMQPNTGWGACIQHGTPDALMSNFSDALLHTFAHMTKGLGWLMSTLVQAPRQVWLVQSPLTDAWYQWS